MRYFLDIAYKGTHFHGWQMQQNAYTVQEALNKVLEKILQHPIETAGSGRTDTGVHAKHQWVHFDSELTLSNYQHLIKFNALLPKDIVVNGIYKATKPDAHARFDAYSRSYEYLLSPSPNPFLKELAGFIFKPLAMETMNEAAQLLLKYNDYKSFSKIAPQQAHHLCTITHASWQQRDGLLIFNISANRFLRGMVRLLVGTLIEVGQGKRSIAEFEDLILAKNIDKTAAAAPADGLYLSEVLYQSDLLEPC
ncbi:MAG: tRNA pseudouridine(38-40) synthase TruA [Bacteroidota bacterium]|jgi:tRNA pseudouridine38-40 synthase